MNIRLLSLLAFGLCPLAVSAQAPSVVQLPSISTFAYSGTVVVPDGGSTSLGGVNRSASGSTRRGLNRAFGSSLNRSHASVSATIIDNDEIDRQLLGGSKEEFLRRSQPKQQTVDPSEQGKALVRYARAKYREGKHSTSFDAYRMAIQSLDGRLKNLATVEFRRVFGAAAEQSLRMASLQR